MINQTTLCHIPEGRELQMYVHFSISSRVIMISSSTAVTLKGFGSFGACIVRLYMREALCSYVAAAWSN
jgi:hypothetical protein